MPFSLYDATIPSALQILRALDAVLAKAEAFCTETGLAAADLIDARLADDMLPLGYQVKSCAVHSAGAVAALERGVFTPDRDAWPTDFAGLHARLADAIAALEAVDRAAFDAYADADMRFEAGEFQLPFTGANFLLSFSQPNFYFHATTAYAILRARGVPIGKRDYLGLPRLKR